MLFRALYSAFSKCPCSIYRTTGFSKLIVHPAGHGQSFHTLRHLVPYTSKNVQTRYCQGSTWDSGQPEKENRSISPEVIVHGSDIPKPFDSFSQTNLSDVILLELQRLGFQNPTDIQSHCLPIALSGRDIVGVGQTGSGKTLAYLLPALVHISQQSQLNRRDGPLVLILAPTRELAQQIEHVINLFKVVCHISCACLYGGVSKGPQFQQLENGVHVCIATPGRLIDLLQVGATSLNRCSYFVLDEADRMLDMGFEPQVREIVNKISCEHQTLMWSATWPKEVRQLASDFLKNAAQITVGSTELTANPNITQVIEVCDRQDKQQRLSVLLNDILSSKNNKVLMFAETKLMVDNIARDLHWNHIPVSCIHGDKSQLQRDKALRDFRRNASRVLVATDVAARGLDITDITHVINYDFPREIESYVHRIGRTARAERTGMSYSFFTREDSSLARGLITVLKQSNQVVIPELESLAQMATDDHRAKKASRFNNSSRGSSGSRGGSFFERGDFKPRRSESWRSNDDSYSTSRTDSYRNRSNDDSYSRNRSNDDSYSRSRSNNNSYSRNRSEELSLWKDT